MPITLLDGILIGFTLVSALLAMVRGFSREILSIASWVAAAAAAYFFYPVAVPYVTPYIDNDQIALAASAAIIFVIALIVVTVITMKVADFIIDSRVGALDRTLGFLYGAARGILVVAVALLFFSWLVGSNPPAWITFAKSRPFLEDIGARIEALLPSDPDADIFDRLTGPDANEATPAPEAPADAPVVPPGTVTPAPADGVTNN
ncbi:CvpA family protein [Tianweitania sediminis]|jgi:membrane protein required for colicin V production|uniref:CvpA family protein n=1 Tax=Tianweitania sediminis TaxID=1502156 RepID=A0A8J7QZL6_9HYPH|nr:CvpA family protein [Tianweitania sediminis]MBP0438995.1 CvpA family protein [Tianweitania sediminis]HEV7415152.1 CvpA family protein [Tianweitania sediminis]